jgi:hypothetical protein
MWNRRFWEKTKHWWSPDQLDIGAWTENVVRSGKQYSIHSGSLCFLPSPPKIQKKCSTTRSDCTTVKVNYTVTNFNKFKPDSIHLKDTAAEMLGPFVLRSSCQLLFKSCGKFRSSDHQQAGVGLSVNVWYFLVETPFQIRIPRGDETSYKRLYLGSINLDWLSFLNSSRSDEVCKIERIN